MTYLVPAFVIPNRQKPGHKCMCEIHGKFIAGEIVRVSRTHRILVNTDTRSHWLPPNAYVLILSDMVSDWRITNQQHLANYFPNFRDEATTYAKMNAVDIELKH